MALLPFAFALLLQAAPAQPDWRPLGTSANGRQTSYDAASIVRGTPVSRVRVRFVEENGYALSLIEIRCAAYDARIVGATNYDSSGTEVGHNDVATPFRALVAGSFLEILARAVCGEAQGPAAPQ